MGKILKENTPSIKHKKKLINFPTLKQTPSGIPKYPIRRMKRLAQGDPRVERDRNHTGHAKAQVKGSRASGLPKTICSHPARLLKRGGR